MGFLLPQVRFRAPKSPAKCGPHKGTPAGQSKMARSAESSPQRRQQGAPEGGRGCMTHRLGGPVHPAAVCHLGCGLSDPSCGWKQRRGGAWPSLTSGFWFSTLVGATWAQPPPWARGPCREPPGRHKTHTRKKTGAPPWRPGFCWRSQSTGSRPLMSAPSSGSRRLRSLSHSSLACPH